MPGLHRKTDPETSAAAAHSLRATELEQEVLDFILSKENQGCTLDDVVAAHPHLSIVTISPRFAPLIRKGLVIDTGERRIGKSGRGQRVMIGRKYAEMMI